MDPLTILFQDSAIIAVDKPSGLLTIPDGYDPGLPNLRYILTNQYGRVWTAHRLDKETSGVVIFALTAEAHRNLSIQFETRNVKKEYRSLIVGKLDQEDFTITLPLRVNGDRRHRTIVDHKSGKPASTHIQLIKRFNDYSEINASPQTGYTHQIRAHLSAIGHPVVNDTLYNKDEVTRTKVSGRLMLHAHNISFIHPFLDHLIEIQSPMPSDFVY